MKKLFVLAVAGLVATSAYAGEMKWNGSAGWRYTMKTQDDGLGSTNNTGSTTTNSAFGKDVSKLKTRAHQIRGNFGFTGGWENVEYGAGLRSGSTSNQNSDWGTVQDNKDIGIVLEQAWGRYLMDMGSFNFNVTLGRQMNPFAYDMVSENFFDNDVRWDGFGWKFNFGMFGLNAGQFILGSKQRGSANNSSYNYTDATNEVASTKSHFHTMYGFQPHMTMKFADDMEAMFAVGYYIWNYDAESNYTMGGFNTGSTTSGSLNTAGTVPVLASRQFNVHNPRQWQFLTTWSLPMNFTFTGEYVLNKKSEYSPRTIVNITSTPTPGFPEGNTSAAPFTQTDRSAWALSLVYGKVSKAHDWSVGYTYGNKGLASVINSFTNSSFAADNKGHTIKASYALADSFVIGWKGMWMKEKEVLNPLTGLAYTGNNVNQKLSTKYMEFSAGLKF